MVSYIYDANGCHKFGYNYDDLMVVIDLLHCAYEDILFVICLGTSIKN